MQYIFKISDLWRCRESRKGNRELEGNDLPSRQSKQYFEPTFFLNVFALALNIVGFYVYVVTVNSLLLNAVSEKSFQFVFIYYLIPVCISNANVVLRQENSCLPIVFTLKSGVIFPTSCVSERLCRRLLPTLKFNI